MTSHPQGRGLVGGHDCTIRSHAEDTQDLPRQFYAAELFFQPFAPLHAGIGFRDAPG